MKVKVRNKILLASLFSIASIGYSAQFTRFAVAKHLVELDKRCEEDSLNVAQAIARLDWAKKHDIIPEAIITDHRYVVKIVNGLPSATLRDRPRYPMFGTWDGKDLDNSVLWIPKLTETRVPDPNEWLISCTASCYTGDQLLLTEDGEVPFEEAIQSLETKIMTVTDDSDLDNIFLTPQKVKTYTISMRDAEQKIKIFQTESGGELKVTSNHPIVDGDGVIKEAADFKVGEYFISDDGSKDKVVSIKDHKFFGKVYNVRPDSESLKENIVIAQGFLNGSSNYQNDWYGKLNRKILVSSIPNDLF